MAAVIVAVKRARGGGRRAGAHAGRRHVLAAPEEPIPAEAQVFRTSPAMLAIEPAARRERSAHPRTLKTVRFLRAYPGAPPRIPHALSAGGVPDRHLPDLPRARRLLGALRRLRAGDAASRPGHLPPVPRGRGLGHGNRGSQRRIRTARCPLSATVRAAAAPGGRHADLANDGLAKPVARRRRTAVLRRFRTICSSGRTASRVTPAPPPSPRSGRRTRSGPTAVSATSRSIRRQGFSHARRASVADRRCTMSRVSAEYATLVHRSGVAGFWLHRKPPAVAGTSPRREPSRRRSTRRLRPATRPWSPAHSRRCKRSRSNAGPGRATAHSRSRSGAPRRRPDTPACSARSRCRSRSAAARRPSVSTPVRRVITAGRWSWPTSASADAHQNIQPVHPKQTGAVCSTCHSADDVAAADAQERRARHAGRELPAVRAMPLRAGEGVGRRRARQTARRLAGAARRHGLHRLPRSAQARRPAAHPLPRATASSEPGATAHE